jgi:hypothetical protein
MKSVHTFSGYRVPSSRAARRSEFASSGIVENALFAQILDKVNDFRCLKPNWDCDGADPLATELVDVALDWLVRNRNLLRPPDNVIATPPGTICFEWHSHPRTEIEIIDTNLGEIRRYRPGEVEIDHFAIG